MLKTDEKRSVFAIDQRWISESEPELGIGRIVNVTNRAVVIDFTAADIQRHYAIGSAPIRRVRFNVGDWITAQNGESFQVTDIEEEEGLLCYLGDSGRLSEAELNDRISVSAAKERLLAGQTDPLSAFALRASVWENLYRVRRSEARGFCGGRISLLAHQFFIASEVAKRPQARVLLADETGLGKTIEACLIMQRWIVSGRIARVLILVPETMVHQWFVELLRKFNLIFSIVDQDFCRQSDAMTVDQNPFQAVQAAIASVEFLAEHSQRTQQAVEASWDLVMVDEAHHLKEDSPGFKLTSQLAEKASRLLLLTATPYQLGLKSHFARLKMLDPVRYHDFESYLAESEHYHSTARLVEKIFRREPLSAEELIFLKEIAPDVTPDEGTALTWSQRYRILAYCVDRFGPGRVMFRNTRSAIKGFSGRKVHLEPLRMPVEKEYYLKELAGYFLAETADLPHEEKAGLPIDFSIDPRMDWLVALLKAMPQEKLLLIVTTPAKVRALGNVIAQRISVDMALFHEELTLLQRDRNAAWFADPAGARLLICSEIGSEGRNFQFASHLILFDLPLDPEQLEQRIGRLDRIGQKTTVQIHVPYLIGSPQEVLVRWFHEGLDQFEHLFAAGPQILESLGSTVRRLAGDYHRRRNSDQQELEQILISTQRLRREVEAQLAEGRDRLLQYASFQPLRTRHLLKAVMAADNDRTLESLMLRIFDHYGIEAEKIGPRTHRLESGVRTDLSFPLNCDPPVSATFDRETALKREDCLFLTWDHPLTNNAMEMLLNSSAGNCAAGLWVGPGAAGLILEAVLIMECVCHKSLHADRFMPPTPVKVAVDQHGRLLTAGTASALAAARIEDLPARIIAALQKEGGDQIRFMLKSCRKLAQKQMAATVREALAQMEALLLPEIARMRELARRFNHPNDKEVQLQLAEIEALRQGLSAPTLRLDALRLMVDRRLFE